MYANGKLWGALDTALNPDGGPQRAGIAWYIVNPNAGKVVLQGYLGATGHDFTYPAIGVTAERPRRHGVHGDRRHAQPERGYASIDANAGVGAWNVVPGGAGAAQDDGFTSYKSQVGNPPRTRWGDYGAAAVDGNSIWIASEYIAHACDYTDLGRPVLRGRHRRQPARHLRAASPRRRRHPGRARQLVDADQQVHAVVDRETRMTGGPAARPALLFASTMCADAFHGGSGEPRLADCRRCACGAEPERSQRRRDARADHTRLRRGVAL